MKNLFNGVLLLDKKKGCTSHDVVFHLRHLLNQNSVGHAGTLDPSAEGLLVMLLGQATKLSSYMLNNNKRYFLTMKLGLVTDSFDTDGKVLKDTPVSLEKKIIQNALENKIGTFKIPVPIFSAVKVKGKKLYEYARNKKDLESSQKDLELPQKEMSFFDLDIKRIEKDKAELEISCTKGSYIRSWVHCVGESLGTGACLTYLKRLRSEPFSLQDALSLDQIKNKLSPALPEGSADFKERLGHHFLLCSEALPEFPFLKLTFRDSKLISRGLIPSFIIQDTLDIQEKVNKTQKNQIMKITRGDHLISLLEFRPFKKLKILRNFPLPDSKKVFP